MPKVKIEDGRGIVVTGGTGLFINGSNVTCQGAAIDQTVLTTELKDISTASETFVISPHAGNLAAVYSIIDGAISSSDATLTIKVGGTTVGTITVTQSGSAAKDVDSATSLTQAVTAGQAIEIETDGASSGTVKVNLTLVIER